MPPHQARVQAAVQRYLARGAQAGYAELHSFYPWVRGAGSVLFCERCQTESIAPVPRLDPAGYGAAVEAFLEAHKACTEVRS